MASRNKNLLMNLEQDYIESKAENLEALVEERKNELIDKLDEYQLTVTRKVRLKHGEEIEVPIINQFVMQNYFFRSINPIGCKEPRYNGEKLSIIWDLYKEIVTEVNIKIGKFIPTIASFCDFIGITVATFKNYKKSADLDIRTISEKIDDYMFNANVGMAQSGEVEGRSTIYRMKVEQNKNEKEEPQIHIHTEGANLGLAMKRLEELKRLEEARSVVIDEEKGGKKKWDTKKEH